MTTERAILTDAFNRRMGNEDEIPPIYEQFLKRTKTGNASFDAYVEALANEMIAYDWLDPFKKNALESFIQKADAFLQRHTGMDYAAFLKQAKPETFTQEDYENLPPKKI